MKIRKIVFLFLGLLANGYAAYAQAGRVGIGTIDPRAGLDVKHDDGIVARGTFGVGNTNDTPDGEGTRLLWIPKLAAFRAGYINGSQWDMQNIGRFSIALGASNTASGTHSTALGASSSAIGEFSTAIGLSNTGLGPRSTAIGDGNYAGGYSSLAMGFSSSTAGTRSVAIGNLVASTGISALSMGTETIASGHYSTAMGTRVTTSGKEGAFIIGDGSEVSTTGVSAPNKFTARFANGYLLYTNADLSDFVALGPGGNAWITSSDSARKTNFVAADGEQFLQKLRGLRLGSWNYKKQDARTMRHYGPMAQEFFSAYGRDNLGAIGNDTTLNAADVDGVAFVLLKALEKRTADLAKEVQLLKKQLAEAVIRSNRQSGESDEKKVLVFQ